MSEQINCFSCGIPTVKNTFCGLCGGGNFIEDDDTKCYCQEIQDLCSNCESEAIRQADGSTLPLEVEILLITIIHL